MNDNTGQWREFEAEGVGPKVDAGVFEGNVVGQRSYVTIAADPRNGDARSLALRAIRRIRSGRDRIIPLLLGFLDSDEPVLFLNAAETLALWGVVEAEPRVKQLLAEVDSMNITAKATDLDAYRTALKSELGAALTKLSRATRSAE